jgi:hypothetical protein
MVPESGSNPNRSLVRSEICPPLIMVSHHHDQLLMLVQVWKDILAMAHVPVPVPRSMIRCGWSPIGAKYNLPLQRISATTTIHALWFLGGQNLVISSVAMCFTSSRACSVSSFGIG